jgi:hypothetical protein
MFFIRRGLGEPLHDANANTWPVSPDLTNYINLARDRVCLDTYATRVLPIITLNPFQERFSYPYVQQAVLTLPWLFNGSSNANPPPSRGIATVLGINAIQSSAYQPPLVRMPWTKFNARYRTGGPSNPGAFPEAFSAYGDNLNFYIATVVGTAIPAEIDCLYLPNPLVSLSDQENAISDPLTELVPLMAARWAMYYMDEQDTAAIFLGHYKVEKDAIMAALPAFDGFSE